MPTALVTRDMDSIANHPKESKWRPTNCSATQHMIARERRQWTRGTIGRCGQGAPEQQGQKSLRNKIERHKIEAVTSTHFCVFVPRFACSTAINTDTASRQPPRAKHTVTRSTQHWRSSRQPHRRMSAGRVRAEPRHKSDPRHAKGAGAEARSRE